MKNAADAGAERVIEEYARWLREVCTQARIEAVIDYGLVLDLEASESAWFAAKRLIVAHPGVLGEEHIRRYVWACYGEEAERLGRVH